MSNCSLVDLEAKGSECKAEREVAQESGDVDEERSDTVAILASVVRCVHDEA